MSKKTEGQWLLVALAAPLVQTSSNCSWLAVTVISGLCMGIIWGMEKLEIGAGEGRILTALQWLWMLLIVSEFLHWTMFYWPGYKSYHAVPLIILTLAVYGVSKGETAVRNISGILLPLLAVVFGGVMFSGIKEIKRENLSLQWEIQTAFPVVVMLIPAIRVGEERTPKIRIILSALVTALITNGVLSMGEIERTVAPVYEMSRSVSLLGVGQRYESLIAAGMTAGYFMLMTWLVDAMANQWGNGKRQKGSTWVSGFFAGLVFISGMRMNSRLLALGTLVLWVVFPVLEKTLKKMKLPLDK